MSRLQSFLRALPPSSVVTQALAKDQEVLNAHFSRDASAEIALVKDIQSRSNLSWSGAIAVASKRKEIEV